MAMNTNKKLTAIIASLLTGWIFVVAQQAPSYTAPAKPKTKNVVVVWDLGDTLVTVDRKELTKSLSKLSLHMHGFPAQFISRKKTMIVFQ